MAHPGRTIVASLVVSLALGLASEARAREPGRAVLRSASAATGSLAAVGAARGEQERLREVIARAHRLSRRTLGLLGLARQYHDSPRERCYDVTLTQVHRSLAWAETLFVRAQPGRGRAAAPALPAHLASLVAVADLRLAALEEELESCHHAARSGRAGPRGTVVEMYVDASVRLARREPRGTAAAEDADVLAPARGARRPLR